MSGVIPSPDRDERLDAAVANYLEAVERGQRPERAEWLARYPDLAPELAEFLDDQEKLQRWTSLSDSPAGRTGGEIPTLPASNAAGIQPAGRLANYELICEIARGGMGIVYRARQRNPSRVVALKMILAGPHATAAELYRFQMETEAAASLDHPHIMPIYEVGNHEGRPFFSMKLMEGGTLAEQLPRFVGDGRAVAGLMIKVARAVHHAHQRGILHRDLKPANILLDGQGDPYVTDFGLCRRVEFDSGMTQSGVIVGTPSYMSPEQAAGRKDLATTTDVYSLGAILYTLLTDRPPFRGNTPLETVRGVLEQEPSRPRMLRPQVDRDLETICLKCLDKQPSGRYGSAEALADDLSRWLAGEPIVARRSSVFERTWKQARRNPAAAALIAVSGLALALLIAFGVVNQNQRLATAQQALAKLQRISKVRQEARDDLAQAKVRLALGEVQAAQVLAVKVGEQCRADPELAEVAQEAQQRVAETEKAIADERARRKATASLNRLLALRDEALIYGSQFAGERPANSLRAQAAGQSALSEVGLKLGEQADPQISPWLTADQQRVLKEACYELLLVLADASTASDPQGHEHALQIAGQALQFGSATSAYHACRARHLKQLGRSAEAQTAQELARSLPAATALDHFLCGYDALLRGDIPAAAAEYGEAVRLQPSHTWARLFLAATRITQAPGEAEIHLTRILDERPDFYFAYLQRGQARASLGKPGLAESDFQEALKRAPTDSETVGFRYRVLTTRGNVRLLLKDWQQAEADLLAAQALRPDAYQAALFLADAYRQQSQLAGDAHEVRRLSEAAEQQLSRAFAASDASPAELASILLHRASLPNRDRTAALVDINRSVELHAYAEALVQQAEELLWHRPLKDGDCELAIQRCEKALAAPAYDPESYRVSHTHYVKARALVLLRKYDVAALVLQKFLKAGGEASAEICRLLALTAFERDDTPEALSQLTTALELEPGHAATRAERGSIYLAMKANRQAKDDFEAVLRADPNNANALAGRGLLRAWARDYVRAQEDAEHACRSGPMTQRLAWMAAQTFAASFGQLALRSPLVSMEESRNMDRYRQRALELLEQSLALTDADKRETFWRTVIQPDPWVQLLGDRPIRQLQAKYLRVPAQAAPSGGE